MMETGVPIRVELLNGKSIAGLFKDQSEEEIFVHCIYKFVEPHDQDGLEDQIIETLDQISTTDLLVIATDLGVLRKCVTAMVLRTKPGKLYEGWWLTRADEAGRVESLAGAVDAFTKEQRRGLLAIIAGAMMEHMEPSLVVQQAPIDVIVPKSNIQLITSLVDEGQEKFFERLASD